MGLRFHKLFFLLLFIGSIVPSRSFSQDIIIEAIKEAAKKVIRAIDLKVQREQNRTIDLQNIQKKLENLLTKLKLEEIAEWTNRQKEIYQEYFDELWRMKSVLAYYSQLKDITSTQKQLLSEYKRAYGIVIKDPHFSSNEREYIIGVYSNILEASLNDVNDIISIMNSFTVQMSDADRLKMINETANSMEKHLSALRSFNERNLVLSLQRGNAKQQLESLKKIRDF
ncbi:conjugal transfer protein TraI [Paraflavitalea sp. CAU 1676]|uniref:conjugal transfer protein TraI n=1 Tax=Paraflavitalea sp. CAU 1676 TaxID=3032598 RepID=UPI0023DA38EE|nr:conjugal transfer protein TraI [Paraflavitalea sp. CAU 1676]MDF2190510.1 conjugal transfer protein TraI [Paraflavitalea sp. CAU 1676]